ncbi:MAG: SH3 domain-containing protein, partial [Deltaproteobacteria bacterium]|nr:SH3 domain-containing protein [Deltaproteobacteria bacterium]
MKAAMLAGILCMANPVLPSPWTGVLCAQTDTVGSAGADRLSRDLSPDRLIVTVERGRVRQRPSIGDILTELNRGDTVERIETWDDWHWIRLADGRTGWAHVGLFKPRPPKPVKPAARAALSEERPGRKLTVTVKRGRVRLRPTIFSLPGESMQLVCDFPNTLPAAELEKTITVNSSLIR